MTYKSQTVSAIVITYNDAATLEQTLYSLHWVDELIVVDRGSTDGTLALARLFTEKVLFHPSDNLTILRRDALSTAKCDWLFLVEPDEWVEEMLKHEIDGIMLNTSSSVNGYTVSRKLKFQGQWIDNVDGPHAQRSLRLVRKKCWKVSESWDAELEVEGEVRHLDRCLGTAPYATVEGLFSAVNHRSTLAAYHHLEEQGSSPKDQSLFGLLMKTKMAAIKAYLFKGGMWKGHMGLTMTIAYALETFLKLSKIRSLTMRKA